MDASWVPGMKLLELRGYLVLVDSTSKSLSRCKHAKRKNTHYLYNDGPILLSTRVLQGARTAAVCVLVCNSNDDALFETAAYSAALLLMPPCRCSVCGHRDWNEHAPSNRIHNQTQQAQHKSRQPTFVYEMRTFACMHTSHPSVGTMSASARRRRDRARCWFAVQAGM